MNGYINFRNICKTFLKACAVLVFSTAISVCSFARDVSFEAVVDSNRISLEESTRLILTIKGVQRIDPVVLPVLDGFDARYVGPQTEVTVVNGSYSSSKSFIYALFPQKTGEFTIPSLSVNVDGTDYQSEPIKMQVIDAGSDPSAKSGTSGAPSALSLQDKIMLVMGSPRKEIYLHEQVPVNIKLFYNGVTISDVQYPAMESTGFTKTDFPQPAQTQQIINGMGYNVVDFKTFITPTREGELTIGPASLQANILYQNKDEGARSLFTNDLFDSFFSSYEKRALKVSTEPLSFKVLPLPEEGKPQDFSGAVGQFDFDVTVGPAELKQGDPITMRMTISGQGDLKVISTPAFNDAQFKIYEPQIKDEGNTKIIERVLIATSSDVKEIPAVSFSYFDTIEKKYKTITRGPFAVTIATPAPGEEFKAVGFESDRPKVSAFNQEVGSDIVYIKERLGSVRVKGRHEFENVLWWIFAGIYFVLWLVALGFYLFKKRLTTDVKFARKFKAPRQARCGIQQATDLMHRGEIKEFYSVIIKTLKEYLGCHLHIPSGSMTFSAVENQLISKGVDAAIVQLIGVLFESSDKVRFALMRFDQQAMQKTLENLKIIIDHLERRL